MYGIRLYFTSKVSPHQKVLNIIEIETNLISKFLGDAELSEFGFPVFVGYSDAVPPRTPTLKTRKRKLAGLFCDFKNFLDDLSIIMKCVQSEISKLSTT